MRRRSNPLVYNWVFFGKSSFCVQLEKVGRGLLREAFQGKRECIVSRKRGGNKKGSVLENAVITEAI